ncbi:hypothetical protein LE191_04185 [Janthinobacterium sp. HSC-3S05]|uniref:hypothetical protein n=1 Tax=Janthinobacterium lividum TaxID=29581 RepID=UPI001CD8ACED|nr:hypothetical protein [Janthinobacterium lividum]MCA1859308.1 hypothetical protein [Janthinobacterium lividum]MCL6482929.1 hypothetical protein [Janthinobacterium lividum]
MDDNNFATSEASHEGQHFATEIETEASAPVEIETPAPADEGSKLPKAPKTTREALERAFDETKKTEREAVQPQTAVDVPPVELGDGPKTVKAPASWKPAAREKFDALPDEVKQEVARREYETDATLAKTASERRLAHEFMQVSQPYAADYQAMGINPLQAAGQFFQIDRALRIGSVAQKAALVSRMIKDYGIDLVALDSSLAGQTVPEQMKPGYDPELAARLDRVENYARQQQQSVVHAQQNQINTTIDQFANDQKNEFFNDVAPHMIGLLQSGAATDLKTAYEQACYANPSVRQVLTQRQLADKARLVAGNASLPNKGPRNGAAPSTQKFSSTRDALEAAFAAADRQQRV